MSIEGQGHSLTLAQSQLHMKHKTGFSQQHWANQSQMFICKLSGTRKWKLYWHDAGHITKMTATPIYGKNPSNIFFSGTGRLISTKLGM